MLLGGLGGARARTISASEMVFGDASRADDPMALAAKYGRRWPILRINLNTANATLPGYDVVLHVDGLG
jgi:hypothetical protein